eukprot:5203814-Heterocapsa_arctica.AAC.1
MHDIDSGCIFGCPGAKDCLKHYVLCPLLNDEIDAAWSDLPPALTLAARVGLSPVSPARCASLFLMFHAAKASRLSFAHLRRPELAAAAVRDTRLAMS